ncbi:MAG: pilus assembly PilX family protein [Trinickia sp.]
MTIERRRAPPRPLSYGGKRGMRLDAKAFGRLRAARPIRHGHRGVALPSALMIASMMLTTSAAWLEASIAHGRFDANIHDHLRATLAADSALTLCEHDLRAGIAPVHAPLPGMPMQWTQEEAFEGPAAYEPVTSWPGSVRSPQCVIEAAFLEGHPSTPAYWITARGFGAARSTQARLQLTIVREAGRERRAWRRIATTRGAD